MMFEHQRKPTSVPALGYKNLKYMIEMSLAISGSREELKKRPILSGVVATISPLLITEDDVKQLFLCGEYGIPNAICTMTNMGSSGPLSPAGSLAIANAEQLAVITLAQTAYPGHVCPYVWLPMSTNMLTGMGLFTTPDVTLANIAVSQLASEFYNMPVETAGLMSDGMITEQALFQKAFNGITAILAGTVAISGLGSVDFSLGASPVQLVIDDEIMEMLRIIDKGFKVDDHTLALDAISRVGPQGSFLYDESTLDILKKSKPFNPTIFDCEYGQKWLAKGAKNLEQKARDKALTILNEHKVPPLPEDIRNELGSIMKKADKELAGIN
jgi:trimethylamine--corrinoid protein Co-methyltransferase